MAIGVLQSGAILLCVLLVGPVTGCDVNPPCYDGEMLVNGCCVSCDKPSPSVCPKGAGIQNSTCGAGCEPCPAGQFNDGTMKQCQLCKNCATQHRDLVQPGCRKDANTICGNCFKGYYVPDEYKTEFDNPGTQICQRCPSNSRHKDCYVSTTTNKVTTPATTAPETIPTTTLSPATTKSSTTTNTKSKSSTRRENTLHKKDKQKEKVVDLTVKNDSSSREGASPLTSGIIAACVAFVVGVAVALIVVYIKKPWKKTCTCNMGTVSTSTSTKTLAGSSSAFSSANSLEAKGTVNMECSEPLLRNNETMGKEQNQKEFRLQIDCEGESMQEAVPPREEELKQRTEPYDMRTMRASNGFSLAQHTAISVTATEETPFTEKDVFAPTAPSTSCTSNVQETTPHKGKEHRSGYEDNLGMPINPMQKSVSVQNLCSTVRDKLAKEDKLVGDIPLDIKEELAKDLDPEDSGVKGWKHFGEKLGIPERELKNLSHIGHDGKTMSVLNIARTRRLKVVAILDALEAIKHYEALHRLCEALVKHT